MTTLNYKNKTNIPIQLNSIKNYNSNNNNTLNKCSKYKILNYNQFKNIMICKILKFNSLFIKKLIKILLTILNNKKNKINSLLIKLYKSNPNKLNKPEKYINKELKRIYNIINNYYPKKINKIKEDFNS
jgi:hypothetical protein